MHKLTQLERLDLGNNEFSELVRNAPLLSRKAVSLGCLGGASNSAFEGVVALWPRATVAFACRTE